MNAAGAPGAGGAGRLLAVAASVVVIATLVAAITVIGAPWTQREFRLDERRVDDLRRIADSIGRHAKLHDALPDDLATLAARPGARLAIVDPDTAAPYGYERTGARSYRLCADFATDTAAGVRARRAWLLPEWAHGRGRQCFDRKLDDDAARTP